ncbi:MAG: Sapep family Mn(2+)-dependent dipeptidase [Oscillospiraceae bacterium]|nr:Sapep family Mn(2+)-dependent dipeptidase [Oscillospiraceae bacterium]
MHERIEELAEEYLDSAVILLSELISFPSIMGEKQDGMPFGEDCARVLEFAEEELSEEFVVHNFDNYAVTAQFDEREPELGILCHLDVVPVEGQEWQTPPFEADIRDGRIYGRGAIDDKGPAAAVITAMRIVKELGIPLRRNARLILGSNEENGSEDMEYYLTKEKFPPMLFTPDGEFPVINGEKGMIRFGMEYPLGEIISITGGSVVNAVPERAEAIVPAAEMDLPEYDGIKFSVENLENNTMRITACGIGAHASTPAQGRNALTALLAALAPRFEEAKRISSLFPFGETDGSSLGIACSDEESGALTCVLSIAKTAEGKAQYMCDIRFPLDRHSSDIVSRLEDITGGSEVMHSEPHYVDKDSDFVRALLEVYEDVTGDKGECLSIGGGTYVHDTDNGVAFGAEWKGNDNHMHGADEFIGIDELRKDIIIYAETILRLCT